MGDIASSLGKFSEIISKVEQVRRIYDGVWSERTKIYYDMIYALKNGRGMFKKKPITLRDDFKSQIVRLDTINKRESQVLNALSKNGKEIMSYKDEVIVEIEQLNSPENKLFINFEAISKIGNLVNSYFNNLFIYQRVFLKKEENFIARPEVEEFRIVYRAMVQLNEQIKLMDKEYNLKSARVDAISVGDSIGKLIISLESASENSSDSNVKRSITNLISQIKPFLKDKQLYGNFRQRVALNVADFPKIIISIGIRMAIIAPLIFETTSAVLGHKPSLKIVPFKEHPQFYIDFYLFAVSYVAYILDVIPGLAKYSIEYPTQLINKVKNKFGSDVPF